MNDVGIYIKDWCGYCALAEELLSRKGVNYRVFDITNDSAGQAHMVRKSGRNTVPQIFIVAMLSEKAARTTLQTLSIAGIALAILGFVAKSDMLLGLVHINEADKWLHAGLAIVIVAATFGIPKPQASQVSSTE